MSKQTFKILNVDRGTCSSYLVLTFDDLHFTQTRIAVYSAITDLILNSEVSGRNNSRPARLSTSNTEETDFLYDKVHTTGHINQNDIESLYNSSIYVLVRSYENIQVKFNELKSQSANELKQLGTNSKDTVSFALLR